MTDIAETLKDFCITPAKFFEFYGLAIWPVRDLRPDDPDETEFEQCPPEEADYFGLYGTEADGTHIHLKDYKTEKEAFAVAGELILWHFGICRKGIQLLY